MRLVNSPGTLAALIHTAESAVQIYMQKHPFLHGPDPKLNRRILESLPVATEIRQPPGDCAIERLALSETRLAAEVQQRVAELFENAGITGALAAEAMDRLAWKFRDFPSDVSSILDVGCGNGVESIFLRAAALKARICAVDWTSDVAPRLRKAAGIEFVKVNIFDYLEKTTDVFDVVFSNHVLEHMYEPDRILTLLRRCLRRGGRLISGMPMDGQGSCFPETLSQLQGSANLPWVSLGSIDLGHPWKTTPADVKQSLFAAGFSSVRLLQREDHLSVFLAVDEAGMAAFRQRARRFQRLLKPIQLLSSALSRSAGPSFVKRCFFALEQRLWFAGNRFKNAESPEILIIAE